MNRFFFKRMTNYDRISEKFSPPTKHHNNDRNEKFYSEIDEPCSTSHLKSAVDQRNRHCSSSSSIENRHNQNRPFLDLIDEPKYHFEADFDFRALKKISAMKNTILNIGRKRNNYGNNFSSKGTIEDSGYQSVLERSQCSQYGTGWLMVDNESLGSNNSADEWDGFMLVNDEKVKIKDMSDLLAARFAFVSGAKTADGLPIMTFPDSKIYLPFPDYRRLVGYLIQVPPFEDTFHGNVAVIDRRSDKWSAVKTLLVHISNYFPKKLRVVYLLKPEGVLQKAIERGYRSLLDSCRFNIVVCQTIQELHYYVAPKFLTYDLDGSFKYNHLEWVQNRMDIERMRSSSQLIAKTLDEFSRCLKDTELPNDAESTQAILVGQKSERDSIKEDFRIAVRRGFSLLKNVRQVDLKPNSELLSPTRLQNVTSIERMLIQLEETEKNFDKFWYKHEQRLQKCLQLRRFEDDFRKLQANFAQHMLYLEENREVGDTVDVVNALIASHKTYMEKAEDDIRSSESLELRGQQLLVDQDKELLEGSLKPKCSELTRMREALQNALQRRLEILRLSKQMHEQISVANAWCTKGVELLTSLPLEAQTKEDSLDMQKKFDDFLSIGRTLQLDSLRLNRGPELKALILMTTTDSSALLNQVSVRIGDIKKMCESRKIFLQKNAKERVKPIGAVSPQSNETKGLIKTANVSTSPLKRANSKASLHQDPSPSTLPTPANQSVRIPSPQSKVSYVIEELLKTEQIYVEELSSVVEHYLKPFENNFDANSCSSSLISNNSEINHSIICDDSSNANFNYQRQSSSSSINNNNKCLLFGNLADIRRFHAENFCRDLKTSVSECCGGGFEQNFDNGDYSKLSCGRNLATVRPIARCFLQNRANFYLYNIYCQNKPRSDALRAEMGDCHPFFLECQRNAGHMLPLGAYLLKPVQRITKYQLLLKELAKHSKGIDGFEEIELALSSMLELLQRLNASMYQTFISGYPGDLVGLGQILLQAKFSVWSHRKQHDKTLRLRRAAKVQHRHVFLYPQAILFCKHRRQSAPFQEYFEYKSQLAVNNLGLSEFVKGNSLKFELWTEGRQEIYQMQPVDPETKNEWVTKVKGLIAENFYSSKDISNKPKLERPVSWNSQTSTESNRSSRELSVVSDIMDRISLDDTNNNANRPRSLRSVSDESASTSASSEETDNHTLMVTMSPENGNLNVIDKFNSSNNMSTTTAPTLPPEASTLTNLKTSNAAIKADWSISMELIENV